MLFLLNFLFLFNLFVRYFNHDLHNFARMANARTDTAYRHFIVKIVTLETGADIEKIVLLPSVRLRHPVNNERPF